MTAISHMHPESICPRWSSGSRYAQVVIQCVALLITCKKGEQFALLKIISLRQFQIAQTRAQIPILIRALDVLSIPFNHLSNMFLILAGAAH
jgi:hypothetical protein